MPMPGLKTIKKEQETATHGYNYVLTCGNMIQIFTPDRFEEIPEEVGRLLSWGNKLDDIQIGLLEDDDPFG